MRKLWSALLAVGTCGLTGVQAQDAEREPAPDLDFLEYLGTWAEEDDEWLAIEEWQKDEVAVPEADPEGSETEKDEDDESE
jgi:hypothetical protein